MNKTKKKRSKIIQFPRWLKESDAMLQNGVIIAGLGSLGSSVALGLAEGGVGRFLLVDNDVVAYNNISRHPGKILDVGKLKVHAVKERILKINPKAKVDTFIGTIGDVSQNTFDQFIDKNSIIVGCAENIEGNIYANNISQLYQIPLISIGFWEWASAGEIFYSIPDETPCYECLFNSWTSSISNHPSTNRHFKTNEKDLSKILFKPGISVNTSVVANMGIKIILALLGREEEGHDSCLLESQYTLICNTHSENIAGEKMDLSTLPLWKTHSIEIDYSEDCSFCKIKRRPNPHLNV